MQHVIVCGHYGCGGVRAAWRAEPLGLIENWLQHVQDVAGKHPTLLEGGFVTTRTSIASASST